MFDSRLYRGFPVLLYERYNNDDDDDDNNNNNKNGAGVA
jgi:hypothetical protein